MNFSNKRGVDQDIVSNRDHEDDRHTERRVSRNVVLKPSNMSKD